MIRLSLLAVYVLGFSAYAFKDWFKSLCALILLMAVIEHPDMPKSILGIPGLNPWNVLLVPVVVAWFRARKAEGLQWDMPKHITVLLVLYLGVVLIGFARMVMHPGVMDDSVSGMVSEYLINTVKWVIPCLLLFDGARTRPRMLLALVSVLGVYLLLGVQVIKWMPLSYALDGESLSERSLKILTNEVGYHRVNISAMLAGASWAIFATRPLSLLPWHRVAIVAATVAVAYAQALTAGRAGYVTWAAVGLILCSLRWRRYLLALPVLAVAVTIFAPGVAQRMLEGFTASSRDVNVRLEAGRPQDLDGPRGGPDAYTITAGRTVIWPFVIERIRQAPFFGYGRQAMVRTGLTQFLLLNLGEAFGHPHNAYLELLFDNGLFGLILIIPFYIVVVRRSISLFMDTRHPLFTAVGGASSALVLALLIAGTGSQTFYPREGWLAMWCAIGLMLRVYQERERWAAAAVPVQAPRRLNPGASAWMPARPAAAFARPAMRATTGRAPIDSAIEAGGDSVQDWIRRETPASGTPPAATPAPVARAAPRPSGWQPGRTGAPTPSWRSPQTSVRDLAPRPPLARRADATMLRNRDR